MKNIDKRKIINRVLEDFSKWIIIIPEEDLKKDVVYCLVENSKRLKKIIKRHTDRIMSII